MGRLFVLSGGAGVFLRVVGLRVAAVGGTLVDRVGVGVVSLGAAGCVAGVLLPWKGWEDGGAGGLSKGGEVERLRGRHRGGWRVPEVNTNRRFAVKALMGGVAIELTERIGL